MKEFIEDINKREVFEKTDKTEKNKKGVNDHTLAYIMYIVELILFFLFSNIILPLIVRFLKKEDF